MGVSLIRVFLSTENCSSSTCIKKALHTGDPAAVLFRLRVINKHDVIGIAQKCIVPGCRNYWVSMASANRMDFGIRKNCSA